MPVSNNPAPAGPAMNLYGQSSQPQPQIPKIQQPGNEFSLFNDSSKTQAQTKPQQPYGQPQQPYGQPQQQYGQSQQSYGQQQQQYGMQQQYMQRY